MRALYVTAASATLLFVAFNGNAQVNIKGNRYLCYPVEGIRGEEPIPGPAKLRDQFGSGTAQIQKPRFVCNPVEINGKRPVDPKTHLVCYDAAKSTIKPKPVSIENEYGRVTQIELKSAELVCIPSLKKVLN